MGEDHSKQRTCFSLGGSTWESVALSCSEGVEVCEHTSKGRGRGTQTRKTAIFFWYSVSAAWAAMVWMGERKKQQQQLRQAAKKEVERKKKSTGGKRRKKKTKRKAECELRKKTE